MKKIIRNIVIVIYAIIAISVTVCLLSYNDYKVTVFGQTSLLIMDSEELEPDYEKGSLVIVDGSKNIEVGDKIFFYNAKHAITLAEVTNIRHSEDTETAYTLEGDKAISEQYVIGPAKDAKTIGKLGAALGVLESKWGFLLLVVLPAVLAFLYEVFEVITEVRGSRKYEEEKPGRRH